MKANIGGLVVLAIAAFVIVMAIKGTQHTLFPQLFGPTPTAGTTVSWAQQQTNQITSGVKCTTPPDASGKCPQGSVLVSGWGPIGCCVQASVPSVGG